MTPSREDYIVNIFRQMEENGHATNKWLSEHLHISKPSVTEMIQKLQEEHLVISQSRKIYLTDKGIEIAKRTLSIHRLWETFLQMKLKFPKELVHHQADLLEHATTEELFLALNAYLEYPVRSSHGSVIYENEK